MDEVLTTAELAEAIPCPRGSVDYLAGLAGVQPRREVRNGQSWKLWPSAAVPKLRRVRKQRRKARRARKGGKS